MSLEISNTTKQNPLSKKEDFVILKKKIIGEKYFVSLVFVGKKKATSLNKIYRNKTYSPNVLSFPIDEESGEIFINLDQTKKEHNDFEMSEKNYIKYLFIHGLLHLKGLDHGPEMDKLEERYLKLLNK